MSDQLQRSLDALADPDSTHLLAGIQRGIEKESLRLNEEGKLAQTPHPRGLGSALTHDSITTDYSEALLEFITPVDTNIQSGLETLADIHTFTYQKLDDETLWCASMPCIVNGDEGIPVAEYGSSNVATMKKVYRLGLGHRYGRIMQTIAGIHYNFSMPEAFWDKCWEADGRQGERQDYITERYLGLIRNFKRHSWLLIYLFGASPAVCASFLRGNTDHDLQPFDGDARSLQMPYGTSLRMGDLGYNSSAQKDLTVCYNSLDRYVTTLRSAIMQPHADYAEFPSGQDGNYEQLNDSLLQIENEFYSPIRPKRVARSGETPLGALRRGGIEYIEVRCVDVNPFTPLGLDGEQIRFLDTFLLYCLLADSPDCDEADLARQTANMQAVVTRGREPGLNLQAAEGEQALTAMGQSLLQAMKPVAKLLDAANHESGYCNAVLDQRAKIDDPELTPSARILREMREKDLPFFRLAMAYSQEWAQHFRRRQLSTETQARFNDETQRSLTAQAELEAATDTESFTDYLNQFYDQYNHL